MIREESTTRGRKESIGLWVGLIGFGLLLLATEMNWLSFSYGDTAYAPKVGRMFAITWLMASWWMTEAIPIPATSLLPFVLFPCLSIMPSGSVAKQYMNEIIMLFLGGFILALAIQKWDLHKRMSLHIVSRLGGSPALLVLGFMLASAGLSMWISNTATTMMLLPIALSVAQYYQQEDEQHGRRLGLLLLLGVAYSASVGGIATLVGTPPNLSFVRIYRINFPDAPEITFLQWLKIGLPITIVLLPLFWWIMTRVLFRDAVRHSSSQTQSEVKALLTRRLREMGPITRPQTIVLCIFAATAVLWMTRADIQLGKQTQIPGWTTMLGLTYQKKTIRYISTHTATNHAPSTLPNTYTRRIRSKRKPLLGDGAVALMMALLLFLLPAGGAKEPNERLMDWETANQLPWGMLLLFGGGFALAAGIKSSGMSAWVGEFFRWKGLSAWGPTAIILVICLLITFLTEFTSNTATVEITLAIVAPIAAVFGGTGVHPLLLMLPITIAASCAFMMPVATPPNAIAYSSGYIPMPTMIRTGIILNVVSTIVITIVLSIVLQYMGISLMQKPAWIP